MSEHDSTPSVEEYLGYLCDDAGVGLETITDRDIGEAVLELHFAAQLVAIRSVLARNREAEEKVSAEIKNFKAEFRDRGRDSLTEYHYLDCLHRSTFLDAAHSMAAVGLIVPLVESVFDWAFRYFKREIVESFSLGNSHERWQLGDRWNHRFVWKNGRDRKDIVKGIVQLAAAIGLEKHLPSDLERTLSVLFAYRNKMFHCGLEWRDKDLKDFSNLIKSRGWADCFTRAESGGDPWIFYLSRQFTDHSLDTVDRIIDGIGAFDRSVNWGEECTDL